MREHLNETDSINTIRLELRHPVGKNNIWVLVEGDTDQKLFSKLIDGEAVKVEIVNGGVSCLRNAVSTLVLETDRVIGIRDADFLHFNNLEETTSRLFLTDVHDSEMMLVSCDDAFRSVVSECINSRLDDFSDLRNELLLSLVFLAKVRWLNDKESLKFNFKGLGLRNFYDGQSKFLDANKCLNNLHKRSSNKQRELTCEEVNSLLPDSESDLLNLCNGHDFEKAFAAHISASSGRGISPDDIGKILRVSYRNEDFLSTRLYQKLRSWEEELSYKLFA